jgi:hypothetical protein
MTTINRRYVKIAASDGKQTNAAVVKVRIRLGPPTPQFKRQLNVLDVALCCYKTGFSGCKYTKEAMETVNSDTLTLTPTLHPSVRTPIIMNSWETAQYCRRLYNISQRSASAPLSSPLLPAVPPSGDNVTAAANRSVARSDATNSSAINGHQLMPSHRSQCRSQVTNFNTHRPVTAVNTTNRSAHYGHEKSLRHCQQLGRLNSRPTLHAAHRAHSRQRNESTAVQAINPKSVDTQLISGNQLNEDNVVQNTAAVISGNTDVTGCDAKQCNNTCSQLDDKVTAISLPVNDFNNTPANPNLDQGHGAQCALSTCEMPGHTDSTLTFNCQAKLLRATTAQQTAAKHFSDKYVNKVLVRQSYYNQFAHRKTFTLMSASRPYS